MAIAVDQNYDKAQRKISTANLGQFAGVDCQLLVEKETHRPIIMDGVTVGGNFKCASTDELEAVKAKADSAVSADSVQWEGVEGVPDNVKNALSFISQSLTTEQKAQVVQNLVGTFLPLGGGTMTGAINLGTGVVTKTSSDSLKELVLKATNGGLLALRTADTTGAPGSFTLQAINGDSYNSLEGLSTGHLYWNGEEIDRLVQRTSYQFSRGGADIFRMSSGLQVVCGTVNVPNGQTSVVVTLNLPFGYDGYGIALAPLTAYCDCTVSYTDVTTTNFKVFRRKVDGLIDFDQNVKFLCIGYWK